MPSTFIKVLLTLTSLSPALLLLYILRIIHEYKHLSFYIKVGTWKEAAKGIGTLIEIHYSLILFVLLVLSARWIMLFAKKKLAIGRINIKSIKPADNNFVSIISSLIPFFVKLYSPDLSDGLVLLIFLVVGLILAYTTRTAYHFNLVLRLFFGYRNYEIQTKEEVTYLMLSKVPLINKKEITQYVQLADHMLVNVPQQSK